VRLLVAAATRTESKACREGIRQAGLENHFEILTTGVGARKAVASLRARIMKLPRPLAVVSSGFAGTWSDAVEMGAWVSASSALWLEKNGKFLPVESKPFSLQASPLPVRVTPWVTLQALGWERPSDFFLESSEPVTVDMETAALAAVAKDASVPFLALRMVTDGPSQKLPQFLKHFTLGLSGEGAWNHVKGTLGVLRNPKNAWNFVGAARQWAVNLEKGWRVLAPAVRVQFKNIANVDKGASL
jgi:Phosphorylase superfamily